MLGTKAKIEKDGSWFIQNLCQVLQTENSAKLDLVSMLTIVSRRVSQLGDIKFKQMPYYRSTLTRFVKFTKVPKQSDIQRQQHGQIEVDDSPSGTLQTDSFHSKQDANVGARTRGLESGVTQEDNIMQFIEDFFEVGN